MEEHKEEKKLPSASQSKQTEDEKKVLPAIQPHISKKERQEVIMIRNWKEYLGESALIIFSVVLALGLTEWFTKLHEEGQTHQILKQLREELISNKEAEADQFQYHKKIMRKIDSALHHPEYAQQFIHNEEIDLHVIVDSGVLKHDLNDIAWQVAKQHNVFAKLDLSTYSVLADAYDNQQRIAKTEDEIGKLLLSSESRKPENLRITLILMRDNIFAWSVERGPSLIEKYTRAIDKLKNY
jgi:hypothetical protein